MCLRLSATDKTEYSETGGATPRESRKVIFGAWFRLGSLSTIQSAEHAVRSNRGVRPCGGVLARPYRQFYLKRLFTYEELTQYIDTHGSIN